MTLSYLECFLQSMHRDDVLVVSLTECGFGIPDHGQSHHHDGWVHTHNLTHRWYYHGNFLHQTILQPLNSTGTACEHNVS